MKAKTPPELVDMVEELRDRGFVRSGHVGKAFLSVPRHLFVPDASRSDAYSYDTVVATHFDEDRIAVSSSSAPTIMATMLEQLAVKPAMSVLEIGAGTGYNAGLLAHLVGRHGRVVSVDLDEDIAAEARAHLHDAGVSNVEVVCGDGWLGASRDLTFDRIIATVGAWEISPHWFERLRVGGVLVMPLWLRPGVQMSVAFVRESSRLRSRSLVPCGFMRLRGPHAGADAHVVVRGWSDRIEGATTEPRWLAAIEHATPERVTELRRLLDGPVNAAPVALPAAGWATRLALDEPEVIAFSGRDTWWHLACGLFAPDRHSLAVFDGGMIVSFGDPFCADELRRRLPTLGALRSSDLEIDVVRHPARAEAAAWVLERPLFDLVVREKPAPTSAGGGAPVRAQ